VGRSVTAVPFKVIGVPFRRGVARIIGPIRCFLLYSYK
jgi:hypothetical protein